MALPVFASLQGPRRIPYLVLLNTVFVLIIVLLACVSKTLATAAVRVNLYFGLLVFLAMAFVAVFGYGTVFLSNGFEFVCLFFTELLVLFLTAYQVAYPSVENDPTWKVQLAFTIIALMVTLVCGLLLLRREGTALFRRMDLVDEEVMLMVRDHELAITMLKVDLLLSLAVVIESGFFLQQIYGLFLEAVAVAVVCVWNIMGFVAIRREELIPLRIVAYGMSWVLPAYALWKTIDIGVRPDVSVEAPMGQVAIFFVLLVGVRVLTVYALHRASKNFGGNLKNLLYGTVEDAEASAPIRPVHTPGTQMETDTRAIADEQL